MTFFIKRVLKGLAIHFATKYAAELVVKVAIEALEKAAERTHTTIDDELVSKLKADQKNLIEIISGKHVK